MQVLSKLTKVDDILCCNWRKYYMESPNLIKYKQCELKYICKKNKLLVGGNKNTLIDRIINKFQRDKAACLIQSVIRRKTVQTYITLHGPAYKDKKCTNDTDFYTLETFENIHIKDFFSFEDKHGFIFGFDFNSIISLIKQSKNATNPYNRNEIPKDVMNKIRHIRRLNRIYYPKEKDITNVVTTNVSEVTERTELMTMLEEMRNNNTIYQRISNVFYEIDQVGNYTSVDWMLNLGRDDLVLFIRFIFQFWNYRGRISIETKNNICPYYNPFSYRITTSEFGNTMTIEQAKNMAITICENLFHTATNVEYKKLSAMYILTSLTVVSEPARLSIPWLYESTL